MLSRPACSESEPSAVFPPYMGPGCQSCPAGGNPCRRRGTNRFMSVYIGTILKHGTYRYIPVYIRYILLVGIPDARAAAVTALFSRRRSNFTARASGRPRRVSESGLVQARVAQVSLWSWTQAQIMMTAAASGLGRQTWHVLITWNQKLECRVEQSWASRASEKKNNSNCPAIWRRHQAAKQHRGYIARESCGPKEIRNVNEMIKWYNMF